jgi:hypothetical protein
MRIRPKEGGSGTDKEASASAGADVRNQVKTLRVTAAPITGQGYCSMSRSIPAGTAFPSEFCRVYIEWALKQKGPAGRPISFRGAALRLNQRDVATPLGGSWRGHDIQRMARRLGIDHLLARMPESFARARVRALYKLCPDLTCEELLATMGTAHPLWNRRAYAFLKECRRDAAKRSPVHRQLGWHLDQRTAKRIRIGELWKREPALTGKQVVEKLKLGPAAPVKWVQQIMNECWKAYAKPRSRLWRPIARVEGFRA